MDNVLGSSQIGLFFFFGGGGGSFVYILGLFLKFKVQNWIFWGYDIFLVNSRCWAKAYI